MERPKQQALVFALGVLLAGGVAGFASYPLMHHEDSTLAARRAAMYDDLGLAPAQRVALDSLFDARNCQYDAIVRPIQPAVDSLKFATRAQMNRVLTAEQRAKLEVRRKDDDARRQQEHRQIQGACSR